ncbi:MAG: hypothetical protein H6713_41625 [Myxococcales bacterium]|nr:hypothetical protein [Myxococcales bacterium]
MDRESSFPNVYQRYTRISAATTLIGVALSVLGAQAGRSLGLLVAGVLLGSFGLIFWIAMFITARSVEPQLAAFRAGEHLARWTIEPEAWNEFAAEMRARGQLGGVLVGVGLGLCGAATGAVVWADGDEVGSSILLVSAVVTPALTLILRAFMGSGWPSSRAPVEVVYGPGAAYVGRTLVAWQSFGLALAEASVDREAARLVLRGVATGGDVNTEFTHRLPFPPREREAAEAVAAKIRAACCPGAAAARGDA